MSGIIPYSAHTEHCSGSSWDPLAFLHILTSRLAKGYQEFFGRVVQFGSYWLSPAKLAQLFLKYVTALLVVQVALAVIPRRASLVGRLTYRQRVTIYIFGVVATILAICGALQFLVYLAILASTVYLAHCTLRLFVASGVHITILRTVDVDATRNKIDSNFMEASDRYVEADCYFGGVVHHVKCGNLGLAKRAAAAVSTVDVHALSMLIIKDRCSGSETVKLETDDDTLTLAVALLLKREQASRRLTKDAEAQVFRAWQYGQFIKVSKWADVPAFIAGLIQPVTIVPTLLLRTFLFSEETWAGVRLRKALANARQSIFHAYDFANRVIARPVRGVIRGLAEVTSKGFQAIQVGPVLRNPHYFCTGALELMRSLVYRSARKVPDVEPEALDQFKKHGVLPALAQAFPDGVDWNVPEDMVAVIKAQKYGKAKTRLYLKALEDMGLLDGQYMLSSVAKGFSKLETYPDYTKEPRTIQCLPVPSRIVSLFYLKKLSDAFFANHSVNLKHLPSAKRPAALQDIFGRLTTVYSWDCSGFEASVGLEVERALWEALCEQWNLPHFLVDMICFKETKISAQGLFYHGPHSRRSGDYWTSLSNSLVNLALQHFVAYKCGVRVAACIVEGDDCLVSYSGQVSSLEARQAFKSLGFVAKEPEIGTGPGSVAFCSTKFDPVDLQPTRDPRNIVDNIGVSFLPSARKNPGFALGQRCASYSCDCPDQPITWVLANIAHFQGITKQDLPWWYAQQIRDEDLSHYHAPPSLERRQKYAEMWDCPIEVQRLIEHCLITGTNFGSIPAIVDFRDGNRSDWDAVIEDEPYPDMSSLPVIQAAFKHYGHKKCSHRRTLAERIASSPLGVWFQRHVLTLVSQE